jgi:hypothetical protein
VRCQSALSNASARIRIRAPMHLTGDLFYVKARARPSIHAGGGPGGVCA